MHHVGVAGFTLRKFESSVSAANVAAWLGISYRQTQDARLEA